MFIELLREIMEHEIFLTIKTNNSFDVILQMDYSDMVVRVAGINNRLNPKEEVEELPPINYMG